MLPDVNHMKNSFTKRVLAVVSAIPRGKTLTYKEVAIQAHSGRVFRRVGTILSVNFDSRIPCHRVIRSDGAVGEYNRGRIRKIKKLIKEGVRIEKGRVL